MDISERIEKIREAKNIRKADMARILDMDSSHYNKFEKRGGKLTIEQLEEIAQALGVSVVELITGEPTKVEDTEKVRELENKVVKLEKWLEDKEELIKIKDERFDSIQAYFTMYLYEEMAAKVYPEGLSKKRYFERGTGKILKLISYVEETEINSEGDKSDVEEKESDFYGFRLHFKVSAIEKRIAEENNMNINNIKWEYIIDDDLKEVASIHYFHYVFTADYYPLIANPISLGLIEDELLIFGFYCHYDIGHGHFFLHTKDEIEVDISSLPNQEYYDLVKKEYKIFLADKALNPRKYWPNNSFKSKRKTVF